MENSTETIGDIERLLSQNYFPVEKEYAVGISFVDEAGSRAQALSAAPNNIDKNRGSLETVEENGMHISTFEYSLDDHVNQVPATDQDNFLETSQSRSIRDTLLQNHPNAVMGVVAGAGIAILSSPSTKNVS